MAATKTTSVAVVFALVLATLVACAAASVCESCSGCGNGRCEYPAEDCRSCPADCGVCPPCERLCGNQRCEVDDGETACNCPEDCGICCVDGMCTEDRGETFDNCAPDCAARLTGVVVDAVTQAAINDAVVTCESVLQTNGPQSTGEDSNAFVFDPVRAATFVCTAVDHAGKYAPASVTAEVGAGERVDIVIALNRKFCSLVGLVYDNTTDLPIEGADVTCARNEPNQVGPRCSSANGQYFFVNVDAAEYDCMSRAVGYADSFCGFNCQPGRNHECDFPMKPLPALVEGDVQDATQPDNAAPLAATVVCVYENGNADVRLSDPTRTSPEGFLGYYTFSRTVPPGRIVCTASAESYEPQTREATVRRGDYLYLPFRLQPLPARIFGCILDEVTLSPIPLDRRPRAQCTLSVDGEQVEDFIGQANLVCDYEINDLNPGEYACFCAADSYEPTPTIAYDIAAGEVIRHDCQLLPAPATLLGTVRNSETRVPINDADVLCVLPNSTTVSRQSDLNGDWVVGRIRSFGSTQCACTAEGYLGDDGRADLERGEDTRIDCNLVPNALRVRVMDGDAPPQVINGAALTFAADPASTCSAVEPGVTNGAGEVLRKPICNSEWSVTASFPGYETTTETVQTREGEEVLLIITMFLIRRDFVICVFDDALGRDDPNSPVPNALVQFWEAGSDPNAAPESFSCSTPPFDENGDTSGRCIVRLIALRNYDMLISAPQFSSVQLSQIFAEDNGPGSLTEICQGLPGLAGNVEITIADQISLVPMSGVGVTLIDTSGETTFPDLVTGPPDYSEGMTIFNNVPINGLTGEGRYCARVQIAGILVPDSCPEQCVDVGSALVPGRIDFRCATDPFGVLDGLVTDVDGFPIGGVFTDPDQQPTCTISGTNITGGDFEFEETAVSFSADQPNLYGFTQCPVGVTVRIECTAPNYSTASTTTQCIPGQTIRAPTVRLVAKVQTVIYRLEFDFGDGNLLPPFGSTCVLKAAAGASDDASCETTMSDPNIGSVGRISNANAVPLVFPNPVQFGPLCVRCSRSGRNLAARFLDCDNPNAGVSQVCTLADNQFDIINNFGEVVNPGVGK